MAKLVWQSARGHARDVLDNYWDGRFPVRIVAISKAMGIMPYQASLSSGISGMIVKKPNEQARAYVEKTETDTRRRFTLAHELGHYVERVDVSDDNDFSFVERREPGQYDLHEFYADEFAGALLMPEEPFMDMLDEGSSLIDIAARFGVSLDAARKRRERLKKNPPQKD